MADNRFKGQAPRNTSIGAGRSRHHDKKGKRNAKLSGVQGRGQKKDGCPLTMLIAFGIFGTAAATGLTAGHQLAALIS